MKKIRFYFNEDGERVTARAELRKMAQSGAFVNVAQVLRAGYIDFWAMDDAHAARIAEKYNARAGEILHIIK